MKKGWQKYKLVAATEKVTDGSHNPPKGVPKSDYLMLSSKNVFDDDLHYAEPRYLTADEFRQEDRRTEIAPGDVLLTIVGTVGRSAVVPTNAPRLTLQRSVAVIRPNRLIVEPRFLMYSFIERNTELNEQARGVAQRGIYLESLRELDLMLPPLPEQQRIVGILDEVFEAIATAKANAQKNLQNAHAIFEAHLHSVFTRRRKEWKQKPLAELCESSRVITYGVIKLGDEVPNGVPCLRTSNVRWLHIETQGMKRIAPALSAEYSRTILKGGEVLVNVRGTLGGVAVVSPEMAGWNVSREVAVVPVDSTRITPEFVSYLIGSGTSQKWLSGKKKGAAYVGINIEDLRLLPVDIPGMAEQREIVARLQVLQTKTQLLASVYERKLAELEAFKKSLLNQAFTGEL